MVACLPSAVYYIMAAWVTSFIQAGSSLILLVRISPSLGTDILFSGDAHSDNYERNVSKALGMTCLLRSSDRNDAVVICRIEPLSNMNDSWNKIKVYLRHSTNSRHQLQHVSEMGRGNN